MGLQQFSQRTLAIFCQTRGHGIEIPRQVRQFVVAAHVRPSVEITLADSVRGLAQRRQRLQHATSYEMRNETAQRQRHSATVIVTAFIRSAVRRTSSLLRTMVS